MKGKKSQKISKNLKKSRNCILMYFEDMIQTSLNDRLDRTKTMLQVQFTVENMFSYGSYVQHSPMFICLRCF